MEFDFKALAHKDRYKLLVGCVVPRPIALVTSLSLDGVINAAPFSFFNALASDPPLLALGLDKGHHRPLKDTAHNIETTQEFVVNMVNHAMGEKMVATAAPFPPEVDELAAVGFTPAPSSMVKPPRIAEAPVAFECRRHTTLDLGTGQHIILGEILCMVIQDEYIDAEKLYVHSDKLDLIARMHGADGYTHTRDIFAIARPASKG